MATRRTDDGEGDDLPDKGVLESEEDLEVEMALLTMMEDMGGATEEVDLTTLSPTEKRALLMCLREHLGLAG